MKAITTKYHGPTTYKGARVSATDMDNNRVTLSVNADMMYPYDEAHRIAAVALCSKMGWPGADGLRGGTTKHGMVWVFTHAQ